MLVASATSRSDAGLNPSPSANSGLHSARRIRCCCSENRGVAESSPWTIVGPGPPAPGWWKPMIVRPIFTRSPSASRRRPASRRPLTHVPFWDQPSSQIVHSPARKDSSACRRDASGSQGSEMSASKRRPTVTASAGSSAKMHWLPVAVAEHQERHPALHGGAALLGLFWCPAAQRDGRVHIPA